MQLPASLRPWVERFRLRKPIAQRGILIVASAILGAVAGPLIGFVSVTPLSVELLFASVGFLMLFGGALLLPKLAGRSDQPRWRKPSMHAPLGDILHGRGHLNDPPLLVHTFGLVVMSALAGSVLGVFVRHGTLVVELVGGMAAGAGAYCGSLLCPRLYPSRYLRAQDCRDCGYDLTGNESGICPECGATIPPPQRKQLKSPAPNHDV